MEGDEQKILTEGLYSLLGNFLQKGLAYGFLVVATYLVSPDSYGIYVWTLSSLLVVYQWSHLSLYKSLSYFVPQYSHQKKQTDLGAAIFKVTILSLTSVTLVGIFIYWQRNYLLELVGRPNATTVVVMLLPLFWLLLMRDILFELFRGLEQIRYIVLLQSFCYPLLHIITIVVFIAYVEPTVALAFAFTVSWGVVLLAGGVLLGSLEIPLVLRRDAGPSIREIFSYSIPLLAGGMLGNLATQVDIILLGILLESSDPAFFRIALSVASLSVIFPSMFISITKPIFSRLEATEADNKIKSVYLTTSRWGMLASIPVAVYLIAIPSAFVTTFFDQSYSVAAAVVPLLVISNVFPKMWGYGKALLEGGGYTLLSSIRMIAIFTVNVVLDVVLIPRYGILGAAIGTTVAIVVGTVLEILFVKYQYGVTVTSWTHWVGLASGALTLGVLVTLRPIVPPTVAVFGFPALTITVYGIGILIGGGLYDEDIEQLQVAAEKIHLRTGINLISVVDLVDRIRRPPP